MKAAILNTSQESDPTCAMITAKMATLSASNGNIDVTKKLSPTTGINILSPSTNVSITQPPFPTVVFSRKTTYHGPYDDDSEDQIVPASLANVVHQTDRNGNHIVSATYAGTKGAALLKPQQSQFSNSSITESKGINSPQPKGFQRFFTNVYSALGLAENGIPPNSEITSSAAIPPPATTTKATNIPQPTVTNRDDDYVTTNPNQTTKYIIPKPLPEDNGKKCLVLDLDETLVHSSFKPITTPDYVLPVEIEGHIHRVYVSKRPNVDVFLAEMGKIFEIVVYTASLNKYANPLLDLLDIHKVVRHRLFRQHCVFHEGNYVKDLSLLDRDLSQTIIIDNSPLAYLFQPQNAIGCTSYIDDMNDEELINIMNFLKGFDKVKDVRTALKAWPSKKNQSGNIKMTTVKNT